MKYAFFSLHFALLAFLPGIGRADPPSEPGLYAIFETNHGAFTCSLFFEQVPMTVANFVGLAEGSRFWIDLETGQARSDPFYNGLTFHRAVPGFMIQGGSRNGQGTDGPGYNFPDEFVSGLVHAKAGILSMANSGPDSNGSQFFITVAPASGLNYKHAVFGEIIDGMSVVDAISVAPTDTSERLLEPVVIQSVEIFRLGATAVSFDVTAHLLPEIRAVDPELAINGGAPTLHFSIHGNRNYLLSYSNDLESWRPAFLPVTSAIPGSGTYDLTDLATGRDKQFYRLLEVDYGYLPENLVGKTLQLTLADTTVITLHFDDERTEENAGLWLGTGAFNDDPQTPLDYLFFQNNHQGRLVFILQGYASDIDLTIADLKFSDQETGAFTGEMRLKISGDIVPSAIHGTFTLLPQ